jgi:hypothetical protein
MNNQLKNIIIAVLLVAVAVLVLMVVPKKDKDQAANVTDYLTCVDAGYPVLESFPAQCRTPDGRTFTEDTNENAEVIVETPARGALVKSPLTVTGKARGNWYFEANLPVTLKDTNGKVLAQVGAQALGEWMTTDYVNFTTVLNFAQPETEFGVLLIQKDNPSGEPQFDAEFAIPVRFR